MATTNPVFQVLASSGNQAILAAGARPDTLAVGQLGVFNYHTGLSVDGSVPTDARDIYIAVGVGSGGILQDINTSAGQVIQVRNAKSITYRPTVLELPKIVEITGYTARCETNYMLKIQLRNGEVYNLNGYTAFNKTINAYTGCCADQCAPCGTGDCIELATKIINGVNADQDGFVVASAFQNMIGATVTAGATTTGSLTVTVGTTVYTVPVVAGDTAAQVAGKIAAVINTQAGSPYTAVATGASLKIYVEGAGSGTFALTAAGGTGVTVGSITASAKSNVTDLPAFAAANPGACVGIRLTTVPSSIQAFCGVNANYNKVRSTDIQVSLLDGFTCNGTVTVIQEARQSEGVGSDLAQLEYFAGGWNGRPGPYRVSPTTSLAKGMTSYIVNATLYQQIDLTYDQFSVGGWLEYFNNLRTIIAIPCTDTTTTTGLVAILDLIFTQFQPMANDVAANNDCDNPNVTTLTAATDGIESLA